VLGNKIPQAFHGRELITYILSISWS
jgi:hypothetical protein